MQDSALQRTSLLCHGEAAAVYQPQAQPEAVPVQDVCSTSASLFEDEEAVALYHLLPDLVWF